MAFNVLKRLSSLGSGGLLPQNSMPVAIDFGVSSLKVLQLAPGDPPSLICAGALDTPDELIGDDRRRLAFQTDALPRLIRSIGVKGRRAVCAIPSGQTFCKHMQMQKVDGMSVAVIAAAAVAQQLSCAPGAIVARHVEVEGANTSGKAEVICLGTPTDLVTRLMQTVKASRLEPVGLHNEFTAVLRAFDYVTKRAEDENLCSVYLDFGAGSTKVIIAHGRRLVFARTIELGGRHFDEVIAGQLKCEHAEARRQRLAMTQFGPATKPISEPVSIAVASGMAALDAGMRQAGADAEFDALRIPDERRATTALAPGFTPDVSTQRPTPFTPPDADLRESLEILTDEIALCLRYHESLFPAKRPDRVVFIGGESRHPGLCQHVARKLQLPAQVADPLARIARTNVEPTLGVDFNSPQPGWTVAVGLCLSPTDL